MDLSAYCINDKERIESKKFHHSYTFDLIENDKITNAYIRWPAYKEILEKCLLLKSYPDRHKITISNDVKSCLKYVSFNEDRENSKLYFSAHYRSQNNLMQEYDTIFLTACVTNYLCGIPPFNEIKTIVYVDEYLIIE